jgi:uncharacterized protein (TIRG00374 family)
MNDASVSARPIPTVSPSQLELPAELSAGHLRRRVLVVSGLVLLVVALITLLPGLDTLRGRLAQARPGWLALAVGLKLLSGISYVAVFRSVFCRHMSWRVSLEIGMSELGANALFPTGGAGGLALGAWALRRGGMPADHIARRTVAFFLLTSVANVVGLILIGLALAAGLVPGKASLVLTLVPAGVAALAIVGALLVGRLAAGGQRRLLAREERQRPRIAKALAAVAEGVDESLRLLREHDRGLIVGAIGYLAFDVMILWATFHAFGSAPELGIIWIAYLIGELGGLIPVPGGLGGVDAGLVGTLTLYGVPVNAAAAAVLAYRAVALWVPAVFGTLAFLRLRRTLGGEAHAIATCFPGQPIEVIGMGVVSISGAEVARSG